MSRRNKIVSRQQRIRINQTKNTVTVYLECKTARIASAALAAQCIQTNTSKTTWLRTTRPMQSNSSIKSHLIALELTMGGFLRLLNESTLCHYDAEVHRSKHEWECLSREFPVKIQWIRDSSESNRSSLQIGLAADYVAEYLNKAVVSITPEAPLCIGVTLEQANLFIESQQHENYLDLLGDTGCTVKICPSHSDD